MSFVAPTAYTLELLMLWTDKSLRLTFGVATVLGVALGSLIYALGARKFRWEGFASVEDLGNQIVGGLLMGFGGVTAMGCTIGQGMTGVFDPGHRFVHRPVRHRRRFGGDDEVAAALRPPGTPDLEFPVAAKGFCRSGIRASWASRGRGRSPRPPCSPIPARRYRCRRR